MRTLYPKVPSKSWMRRNCLVINRLVLHSVTKIQNLDTIACLICSFNFFLLKVPWIAVTYKSIHILNLLVRKTGRAFFTCSSTHNYRGMRSFLCINNEEYVYHYIAQCRLCVSSFLTHSILFYIKMAGQWPEQEIMLLHNKK